MNAATPTGSYRKPRRFPWRWALVLVIVGGAGYYFFIRDHKVDDAGHAHNQLPVNVGPVTYKDVPVYLSALGTIQAYNTVTIRPQVDGQLVEVKFREGQDVKVGDVLAQIDARTFKASYDQAVATKAKDEASLTNAKLDLKRYVNLGNSVSGQIRDTQRTTVKQLEASVLADQAAVDSAKTQLSYTTITAPINGRTGIRQVDAGNIVHASDTAGIVVVTQLSPITVIFSLPQQNLSDIVAQLATHPLTVETLAADNRTVTDTGTLALIDNEIDQTTGTIRLKATLPNAHYALWPGGFTNVRLLLNTRAHAMTIPTVAVQHGPQGAYVFLYHADSSTVSMQPVTVAMTVGEDTVIDKGLADGASVVTDGMARLQEGSHVSLTTPKPDDAAAKPSADTAEKSESPADSTQHQKKRHAKSEE